RAVTALSLFDAHFLISQFASVIYVSNLQLSAIILWHVPAIRRYYKNDLYVDVTFTFFLAWTFVSNLLYCAPFLLIRPFDFFKLYSLPCVAFFLNYAYQNKRYSLLAVSLLLAGVSTYVSVRIFLTPLP
ncbi:MAG: hypothetical protein IJ808_02775, partial [Muribaculaceae bacterium]|nr:hypothetical protein [Muribaculaceae bacterium]